MAAMGELPTGSHPVVLGKTFTKGSAQAYHTIKYDSKPMKDEESVESYIGFGDSVGDGGKKAAIVVPKLDPESQDVESVTVYRGQKAKAKEKDCLLLYNHDTGEFRLEQLSSQIRVKKTRSNETTKTYLEAVKAIRKKRKPTEVLETDDNEENKEDENSSDGESGSSSDSDPDSSSEGEDSDKDNTPQESSAPAPAAPKKAESPAPSASQASNPSQLHDDLRLSDSSDDDDS